MAVAVYIYASHTNVRPRPYITWRGEYVGLVKDPRSRDLEFRPPSTLGEEEFGHWAFYWHVRNLRELEDHEQIPTSDFVGWGKNRTFIHGFIPEGPTLVEPL